MATSLGSLGNAAVTPSQRFRMTVVSATVTGTATVSTGLTKVQAAFATVTNGGTSIATGGQVAAIASISGGNVVPVVYNLVTSTNSISAAGVTVQVVAIGN